MDSQLSPNDLSVLAEEIRTCAEELMAKRGFYKAQRQKLQENHAPASEIEDLSDDIDSLTDKISDLLSQATQINAKAIVVTITDLDDAGKKIQASTKKVQNAVNKLKDIKNTLNIVQDFLALGNAIIGALVSKNPVVEIAGIIKGIDTFTQQLSTSTSRGIPQPEEPGPVVDKVTTRLPNTSYILEISIKIQPANC